LSINNVLLYSGGIDSTVLLYKLKPDVEALLFDYGQRHIKELQYAAELCGRTNVQWNYVPLDAINHLIAKGSQAGREDVPLGHYAEESMKRTIVPNRNSIMLTIAIAHAITIQAKNVYFAAHAGDHAIYPDCRPEFVYAFNKVMRLANAWTPIEVWAPFLNMTKADIVQEGARYGVPFQHTWSCYLGGIRHCGRCGTCVERKEAFQVAGVEDPTEYEGGAPNDEQPST
jgi:7-cyano-7-deazaguanine synthase